MEKQFLEYSLIRILGKGGMSEVYLAEDPLNNRLVALKILPHTMSSEAHYQRRFRREIDLSLKMDHKNILRCFEGGFHNERFYLVTEFNNGQTLGEILDKNRKIPLHIALFILDEVLKGLSYAHKFGVVHRDIKPSNIMISDDGYGKLMDFGLIKQSSEHTPITESGHMVGTPMYMSPEQVMAQEVDQRSDLFSLGVVLFELLTGVHPFQAETIHGIMMNILQRAPSPVLDRDLTLPWDVKVFLEKFLAKKAEARYQSADEARKAMAILLAKDLDIAERETRPIEAQEGPPPKVAWYIDKKAKEPEKPTRKARLFEPIMLADRAIFRSYMKDSAGTFEFLNRERAKIHFARGENIFYFQQDRTGEAAVDLHISLLLEPTNFEAKVLLRQATLFPGMNIAETKSPQILKVELELEEKPGDDKTLARLAKLHALSGNFLSTVTCLRRLLMLRPKDVYAQNQLALLLGRPKEKAPSSNPTFGGQEGGDKSGTWTSKDLDHPEDDAPLRLLSCPKCGRKWYYPFCPYDGAKL